MDVRQRILLTGLAAIALVACSNDGELRQQLSELQTQVAAPTVTATPTEAPTATPTPDTRSFCSAVGEFQVKRQALIDRFNELTTELRYFESFGEAANDELYELLKTAREVAVPLPPKHPDGYFERMNILVLALKSEDDRLLSAVRRSDDEAFRTSRTEANALDEELSQLYLSLCD